MNTNGTTKNKRSYHSKKREEQAANTLKQIIEVARGLFLQQGYTATTITEIADGAGISPETIYATFGSKGAILAYLIDVSLAGDYQAIPVLNRDWLEAIRNQSSQRVRLRMLAHLTRSILERVGPIHTLMRAAAVSDPEISTLRLSFQNQRLTGQIEFVKILAEVGTLHPGLNIEEAGEIFWIIASPELHHILTVEHGWTNDQYESWLFQSLEAQLLPLV
jgi:AcrR family transcriptional regulator